MNEQKYIETRLKDQMIWHDKKSIAYKKHFQYMRIAEIILASSLPFFFCFKQDMFLLFLSICLAVLISLSSFLKFNELWVSYRITSESLKHQNFLYQTQTEPYENNENRFQTLVKNVEAILSNQNVLWKNKIIRNK